jgi:hypothetical protein
MIRKLIFLLLTGCAVAQVNYRYDGIALGPKGPIPNALVAVCTQPANTVAAPCTPLALLCSSLFDLSCNQPNPVTADGLGNFHFYIPNGDIPYTAQIYGPQVIAPYVLADQGIISGGTAGSTSEYPIAAMYAGAATGSLNVTGVYAAGGAVLAEASNNFPTTTLPWSYTLTSAATASTSTVIGVDAFESGSNSVLPILAFYQFSEIFSIANLTNARYWAGLANWNNGSGTGQNSVQIIGTTAYANDLPNKTTLGFRYSAGTDTHWQAVSLVANNSGVLSTVVDTGVTPDTNTHLFQMATNVTGTSVTYYIDGVSVATILTNLPNPASTYDALASPFLTGDNKNTATSVSATFYQAWLSLK